MASGSDTIGVTLEGDWGRSELKLGQLVRADFAELTGEIEEILIASTTKRFRENVGPDGKPWKPLKKDRPRKGSKILVDTGRLRSSIHGSHDAEHAQVGSNVVYSRVHQLGFDERGIPARPYLGISEQDQDDIEDAVKTFLGELVG